MHTQDTAARSDQDGDPQTRASDAEREQAVDLLSIAFSEGRLDSGEHAERLNAAYAARTRRQLQRLTADLPAPDTAHHSAVLAQPSEMERCLQCVLMFACPPIGFAWWYLSRRRAAYSMHDMDDAIGMVGRRALR